MPTLISFDVSGSNAVLQGLGQLEKALQDLRPFWRDVFAPKYFAVVQDLFATGGRPRAPGGQWSGGAWTSLSPKYAVWKAKNFPGKPILVRTGALKDSVTWSGNGLGPGGVFQPEPQFVIVGSAIPYAPAHQKGTKHMPARTFMPTPDPAVFGPLLKAWLLKNVAP